ncbi:Similar to uniprot/P38747 Saccharomyces cerevisiae YHL013c, related [Neospora caninum Liverpool]|uniref:Similar to uniprot/P38747 Saccharomyces cerevisiae YHL013c, related n=1 Tax=Neospora caninum (strain Liverpool) TaxID=572307 RepID=F0VE90_NEOCL|nr:Similar to uniprot/P38747 Saccharomyces cerevisiae YHL013c, related [Neospora caninum Liverpool]CBZ52034.1 Similar to uniprot/P38747 Saccharomyces cerevisiae YHL013c, related [Neospora caninum Liverpool]CEL65995.1 TPA: Similar to uniprot/P38747 Saccharomyces cerevisiae YHL013c, related [Neospora caninum Liverpool]|eukprot:XP_003882066.1 Similar to uniprot/P38747 Saccharomyces cerevisiae YHL013c, related [Neospora caninum Liverpool]
MEANGAATSWGPVGDGSGSDGEEGGSRRKLLQKHRKEIKDLQAASKRALAAAKGKGAKQQLEREIRQKEADLLADHQRQLAALSRSGGREEAAKDSNDQRNEQAEVGSAMASVNGSSSAACRSGDKTGASDASVSASPGESADAVVNTFASLRLYGGDDGPREPARLSKAQQRRRKKRAEEEAREEALRLEREEAGPDPGQVEWEALRRHLASLNLAIHSIAADGHCMYRAICHQMQRICSQGVNPAASVETLRLKVADFLEEHREDFQLFLDDAAQTQEGFEDYCEKIRSTAEWGGEVELQVISKVLQRRIELASMNDGEFLILNYGEDCAADATPLRLAFHRHLLAAGGHYNSVVPAACATPDSAVEVGCDTE